MGDSGSIYFLVLIPVMWCFISWTLSRVSGWNRLAECYRETGQPVESDSSEIEVESAHMRSARMGAIHYHSMLSFRVSDSGLKISILFLFRLGHPPLFIPWDQMHHVEADLHIYSHKVKLSIGKPTIVRAMLPGWVRYRMPIEMRPQNPSLR